MAQQQFPVNSLSQHVMQQQPAQAEPAVVINQSSTAKTDLKYPPKLMLGLTITQLICGVLSIGFGITTACLQDLYFEFGAAIWCGFVYCMAGSLGIPAARTKRKGFVISYMVLSIISVVFCSLPFISYIIYLAVGYADDDGHYVYVNDYSYYGYGGYYKYIRLPNARKYSVFIIIVIVTLVEAIVAIVSSAYCCRAVCCCQNGNQQVVYYYPNTGQPMPVAGFSTAPPQAAMAAPTTAMMAQYEKGQHHQGIPVQYLPVANMQTVAGASAASGFYAAPAATNLANPASQHSSPPPSYSDVQNQ